MKIMLLALHQASALLAVRYKCTLLSFQLDLEQPHPPSPLAPSL